MPSARILTATLLISICLLQGCSEARQKLYVMAMDYERDQAGLEQKSVVVNGRETAYYESNAAPQAETIVLLHGFAANKENWLRFSRYLTPQYHILAPDLPGHGDSTKDMNLSYHIEDQVRYLDELMTTLGVSQFHLVGNSMGGAISSLYAARHPDKITTLSLFDPAGIYDHESEFAKLLKEGENPLIVENEEDFEQLMNFAMEEPPFVPWPITTVIAERSIANKAINEKIFGELLEDFAQLDFKQQIRTISAPTFILWGEQDRVIAWQNAEQFTSLIPNSRKLILPHVGHAPMIEEPEKSAEILKTFIETTKASRS
ncbi:alpha/beta hydrolase [Hahella sp. CCB-MM4]|uniref:alpha/beta fold hydrolase n=1 Tax=Hahella sp. (strain CCB-MM4) TaxID=1926491 RepID=UPI000B9C5088|nr:alpha/beta hydrolase [Hahella sp. CCB-MM4]OZG74784.1 alpha/beta hydrolase [Hahella sp. CCB-MM4]